MLDAKEAEVTLQQIQQWLAVCIAILLALIAFTGGLVIGRSMHPAEHCAEGTAYSRQYDYCVTINTEG